MFRRKKNNHPSDEVMAEGIKQSEDKLKQSKEELETAKEVASILKSIRQENHIVITLREVLNGR